MKYRIKEKHFEGFPECSQYWVEAKFWWWPFWLKQYDAWDCHIWYSKRENAEQELCRCLNK